MTKIQTYTGSIYLIINKLNNKKYVGQTTQKISTRFAQHCSHNGCPKLYNAIKKYGKDSFKILTLKMFACSDYETLHKQLDYWETWYINYYNSVDKGYNCTFGGQKSKEISEETRKKISENKTRYIKEHPEYLEKLSKIMKGRKRPEEVVQKWCKPILQFELDGTFVREWKSTMEARRFFGIDNSHITAVCKGKRKSAYGYKWKYKTE